MTQLSDGTLRTHQIATPHLLSRHSRRSLSRPSLPAAPKPSASGPSLFLVQATADLQSLDHCAHILNVFPDPAVRPQPSPTSSNNSPFVIHSVTASTYFFGRHSSGRASTLSTMIPILVLWSPIIGTSVSAATG